MTTAAAAAKDMVLRASDTVSARIPTTLKERGWCARSCCCIFQCITSCGDLCLVLVVLFLFLLLIIIMYKLAFGALHLMGAGLALLLKYGAKIEL